MAVSKKLRFEVFRRDNFACRYCGLAAMDGAVLEVDHVTPRADGGADVPTNLVTACDACNSGKSDTRLTSPLIDDVPQGLLHRDDEERQRDCWRPNCPTWAHDIVLAAGAALSRDWSPTPFEIYAHIESVALAICSGRPGAEIVEASLAAGEARRGSITSFLPPREEPPEGEPETTAYLKAVDRLRLFVPFERHQLFWHARLAAGAYQPTMRELVRAAAGISVDLVEEHGRSRETLLRYLDALPQGLGGQYLVRATADWDREWQGRQGHAAWECPNEVLELAVTLALEAQVTV